jgi:alkylglycerol monooxygenase
MELHQQLVMAMAVFITPIVIDAAVAAVRRRKRYRLNDVLANLTLSLLTVVGTALAAGLTLWVYVRVQAWFTLATLSTGSPLTWLIGFLTYDFFYYWAHRMHHEIAVLWGVHAVHHSGEDMNYGLAVRQSALGDLTTWVFFLPLAIIGVPPEVYLGVAGIQLFYQYFIHNTYVPALGVLEYILVTPSQHRVHHGRNTQYCDTNYGNILVLWDRLFGSYQAELPEQPAVYGLRHSVKTWNPITLHTHTFVETARKAASCTRGLDKLRCFIKGPGWVPPSLAPGGYPGPKDDGPSKNFVKYDPPMARGDAVYCTAQFVALLGLVALTMLTLSKMSLLVAALAIGLIVVHAWALGGWLDRRPMRWRLELARWAVMAFLVPLIAVEM